MDISTIKTAIDNEVSTRSSDKFGIKVGGELYKELAKAGFIKLATFSVWGTGAFPQELPAYEGKYYIFHDWELDDYAFKVGTPAS
jgi:hypothetical protein